MLNKNKLNKKGQAILGMNLWELIGIILVVLVIIVLINFAADKYFAYIFDQEKKAANDNFDALVEAIQDTSSSTFTYDSRTVSLSIPGHTIVAFNKANTPSKDKCGVEEVAKPAQCAGVSCICLYEGRDEDMEDNKLERCEFVRNADDIFTLEYYAGEIGEGRINIDVPETIYKNIIGEKYTPTTFTEDYDQSYSYLYIYGECDDWPWATDVTMGIQNIYVESIKGEGVNHVLVAANTKDIQKRSEELAKKYPKESS